jgi:hypothetical protein
MVRVLNASDKPLMTARTFVALHSAEHALQNLLSIDAELVWCKYENEFR